MLANMLREAWRVLPGVAELEMYEAIAGLRPALQTLRDQLDPQEQGGAVLLGLRRLKRTIKHNPRLFKLAKRLRMLTRGGAPGSEQASGDSDGR